MVGFYFPSLNRFNYLQFARRGYLSWLIKKWSVFSKISGRTYTRQDAHAFRNYIPRLFNAAANCDWPFINVLLDGAGSTRRRTTTDTFPPLSSISMLRARALPTERLWFSAFSAAARNVSHVCARRWIFQRDACWRKRETYRGQQNRVTKQEHGLIQEHKIMYANKIYWYILVVNDHSVGEADGVLWKKKKKNFKSFYFIY